MSHTWLRLVLSGKFSRRRTDSPGHGSAERREPPVWLEDQVVAAVFGELAWIADGLAVKSFLCTNSCLSAAAWMRDVTRIEVELWPWWTAKDNSFSVEPDVVLRFDLAAGASPRLMTVEAKLDGKLEPGQLSRQQVAGREYAARENRQFEGVVLVTGDYRAPAIVEPPRVGLELDVESVYWCSWRELSGVLPAVRALPGVRAPRESAVLDDVESCMSYWQLEQFRTLPTLDTEALGHWATLAKFSENRS